MLGRGKVRSRVSVPCFLKGGWRVSSRVCVVVLFTLTLLSYNGGLFTCSQEKSGVISCLGSPCVFSNVYMDVQEIGRAHV